jgi:large subunit ribosomal protein L10
MIRLPRPKSTLCSLAQGFFVLDFLSSNERGEKKANMLKEKKMEIVSSLVDDLSGSTIIIATNYQGLLAKQMADLRDALAKAGVEYHVVKNTLLYRAADQAGKSQLRDIIEGPVALAFGHDDVVSAVKTLNQYIKSSALSMQIRGGLLGDRILPPEELASLANLPPREVLISRLLGQLQAPVATLHNLLSFPLQGLLTVLQRSAQTTGK